MAADTFPPPSGLRRFFRYDELDLSRVISSNLVSADTLLYIRAFVSLHLVAVFITTLYVSARDKVFYMVPTTFTNLSNIGLTAYYLAATWHSYKYTQTRTLSSLRGQHWFLTVASWMLYGSVAVYHIVVPAIYWGMLFDPNNTMDPVNEYVDYSHHGVDLLCMVVELVFNRMDLFPVHVLGPLFFIILYMFLAWVYFAARAEWLYGFLDWSKGPIAAGWYLGLLAVFTLLFFLQLYLHKGRDALFKARRATVASQDGTGILEKSFPTNTHHAATAMTNPSPRNNNVPANDKAELEENQVDRAVNTRLNEKAELEEETIERLA
ncbi:hypothetical protein BGZ73_008308 [Actinomortierella ambigua]|nr:hypothetical protein BGZ73_008308 [Actinomortierella ambigua]